jgi:beta-lactamase regulating signal transducer with metallopeptidase domain
VQAILNWLWQGCLVVAVAALLFGRVRRTSATTRYTLWWATLGAVLLLPLLPLIAHAAAPSVVTVHADAVQLPPVVLPRAPWWLGAAVMSIWAVWSGLALWQVAAGLVRLQRARRDGVPLPVSRENRLRYWPTIRHTGRRARVIASSDVRVAAVLGLGAPTIAVAPEALDALDDEALDHVLLHEWAHVQRRDDVSRLLHVLVRAVAGLHPAIWWIGRRMDVEREVACDDRVIQITRGAKRYAACLTQMAAAAPGRQTVMLAPSALQRSQLRERVRRLLDGRRNASTARSAASLAAVIPVLAAITLASASVELVGTAPAIARALKASERAVATTLSPPAMYDEPAGEVPTGDRPDTAVQASAHAAPAVRDRSAARQPQLRSPIRPLEPGSPTRIPVREHGLHRRTSAPSRSEPLRSSHVQAAALTRAPSAEAPALRDPHTLARAFDAAPEPEPPSPWNTAALAGVSVGRGSQKAALATAGFFTRAGRRIAGAF